MNPNLIISLLAASAVQIVNLIAQYSGGNLSEAGVKDAWMTIIGSLTKALDEWNAAESADAPENKS